MADDHDRGWDPPLSGAAPLLIQRSTDVHPASRLPDRGLRLRRLRIRHPDPERIARLLAQIGLAETSNLTLHEGAVCALAAEVDTPSGVRALGDVGP
mgnify:CR=1 FL=1